MDKLRTKLLMEIEEHEIKNIEYLRRNNMASAKISDIFELLSKGYQFSGRACKYCESPFLFKEKNLVCVGSNCDPEKII